MIKPEIKDLKLARKGKNRIDWAGSQMKVLKKIGQRFEEEGVFKGITIGACLHVTAETANLMLALKKGGAILALCASNPLSTQDDVAASLVSDFNIPTFAIKGETSETYYSHLSKVLEIHPNIIIDDGADLTSLLHSKKPSQLKEVIGSSEETTTGVIRLKAMLRDRALKIPVMAVNDSDTKHLFDNRYGTGQSTIDGIIRATNILLAGKKFLIAGYGWCGRGIAARAKGMGAQVLISEVDPIKALEATMDGFEVLPLYKALPTSDIIITATGNKGLITVEHLKLLKDGAILANSGHFNVEFDYDGFKKVAKSSRYLRIFLEELNLGNKKIYVLGEGRLINLVSAEGHPPDVMDLSFANQALAAEYFVKNKRRLSIGVYKLPQELDKEIAKLKLETLGIEFDRLTSAQKKYLESWTEGT